MTRSDIIDLVNVLTENKAKPFGNKLQQLYMFIVQDICKRKRYWWRKIIFSFNTQAGSAFQNYDLLTITTTPAITDIAIEEIIKLELVVPKIGTTPQFSELTPIFDSYGRASILENTQPGQPGRYCFLNNDWHNLTLDPSDAVYKIYLDGWAMPNPASTDSSSDAVPLIPPWGHNAIVEGMIAYVWENAYGARDARTLDYKNRYEQSILNLQMRPQFTTDNTQQVINSSDSAIRST